MYKPSAIEMKFGPDLLESRVADSYNLLSTLVILDIDKKCKKNEKAGMTVCMYI